MSQLFVSIGTGPGNGISTASRFAREGFDLVLASTNAARLASLAEEVRRSTGRSVETVSLDATNASAVQQLADRFGDRVGVVHYNAALLGKTLLAETSAEAFNRNLQVDITGGFTAIRSFFPAMQTRHSGTILLTGGGYALAPSADFLALSVGKAGIRCMTQALFQPLAAAGVHIATLTIARSVSGSADNTAVAEAFWQLHSEPQGKWTWEATLR